MEKLYTYDEAASALGLSGKSSIQQRLISLSKRGKPLSIAGGELFAIGKRVFLTEHGLMRLRSFEPRLAGRPKRQNLPDIG